MSSGICTNCNWCHFQRERHVECITINVHTKALAEVLRVILINAALSFTTQQLKLILQTQLITTVLPIINQLDE